MDTLRSAGLTLLLHSAGERALLPAVRAAAPDTLIITDGFSCREQITQTSNRHPLHLAEVLAMAMRQERA